jgi:DNA repair exonuclease SbcCD nuclease subunit
MKKAILGDTHFGMRGDSLDFHRHAQKFYDNVFFPYLIENKIDRVYQLGDLFDRRKFINFNSLYQCRKYFFDKLRDNNIKLFTLLGNHDIAYKNTLEVNSSQLLLNEYKNVFVIDKPDVEVIDGVAIDIIPWICDDNQKEVFDYIEQSKAQICFGHFEIDGFEMDRGNVYHGGLDKSKLSKYDVVLSGHFHHKSDDGQIFYVGTPYEITWSDYNDPRGFHIFDTKTREMEFIANPHRMFHKVVYDDAQTDFDYWKNFDYASLKECYVRVVSLNKQNPYLFDNVIDNLYKSGAADISIVEDFKDTAAEDDIIDQAEDTMTILGKYIDNLTLDVEPEKLKTVMRQVYIEAINTEITE